jgi:dipeptidyl aminopeptidase/acylaminoacyl peptidase
VLSLAIQLALLLLPLLTLILLLLLPANTTATTATATVSGDELSKMYACSPVLHAQAAQAPTLIALGAKDRRVPFSQGMEWYHSLKSRGISAKLLCYPEDVHAIGEYYQTTK